MPQFPPLQRVIGGLAEFVCVKNLEQCQAHSKGFYVLSVTIIYFVAETRLGLEKQMQSEPAEQHVLKRLNPGAGGSGEEASWGRATGARLGIPSDVDRWRCGKEPARSAGWHENSLVGRRSVDEERQ